MNKNLDALRAHRDTMEDLLNRWISGADVDPDMYAAANTPDDVFKIPGLAPIGWADLKEQYNNEADRLVVIAWNARRAVRVATGHATVREITEGPKPPIRVRQGERLS